MSLLASVELLPSFSAGDMALLRCFQNLMQLFRNGELQTMRLYHVCQPATDMKDTLAASPAGMFLSVLGFIALRRAENIALALGYQPEVL